MDRVLIPGIAGITGFRNLLNYGTRRFRSRDDPLPRIGYRARVRGFEILGHAPRRRDNHSKDEERTDVEPGVPFARGTEANENRRETFSPRP
jgi:hypothetical protein